ncbi:MAG: 23S rRNA (adenine(2503)-C(2))-methyltransferase RlmN [Candidatus Omnitrophica bacterium CG11_big_fil_rev_8_21_14_0_20_42_13]|uniref:Probable dual-specificity RNA methyltransferase RlmN n=1 Tax=Candidatus Ghiorseimicrobium undicola TaxID=1974746 RepID=A0A2H0LXK7_9BACT|nr:MAG: 23S rRNA (adenine(2503)-C(2))-methyltransferase RlmN [Candidatus Omnitrophica bacterium CG11_big_fil_rev_8_21_14_0_20_42_13]
MQDIKNLSFVDLNKKLISLDFNSYAARQVFDWLYRKKIDSFEKMTNLSKQGIAMLKNEFYIGRIELLECLNSQDGTEKFLFKLQDNETIESVFIPAGNRNTVCLSSQVGCKFKCLFCASGKSFSRNLSASEITSQLSQAMLITSKKITNIVFMGIGEPFDNYDNVLGAIRILNQPLGFNIGARHITISTCGIIDKIERLKEEGLQVELSISLHAAGNELRNKLMPVNKKYPLKELIKCAKSYAAYTGRQVTFEYVLIKGINDAMNEADKLANILSGANCKVNLILYNAAGKGRIAPVSKKSALNFKNKLIKNGVHAMIRLPRGADIQAACGQLRIKNLK